MNDNVLRKQKFPSFPLEKNNLKNRIQNSSLCRFYILYVLLFLKDQDCVLFILLFSVLTVCV